MQRLFLFTAALVLLAARVEAKNDLLYPIVVGKFENHSTYTGPLDLSATFGTGLSELLNQTGLFVVIPEAELPDPDKATAGMPALQLLVKGEITSFVDGTPGANRAEITAVVTVVDVFTGQVKGVKNIVSRARYVGPSAILTDPDAANKLDVFKKSNAGQVVTAATQDVMGFCVAQLVGMPWTGNVILVKGNQIYFNRGQREGVAPGQVFRVGSTEVVRDPGTGDILDNRFTEKAQIRVDSVKERVATCSLVIGSGIERGMAVRLKE